MISHITLVPAPVKIVPVTTPRPPSRKLEVQDVIVKIIKERQRGLSSNEGVLPKTVQAFLDFYRAEQTLRRDMAQMANRGHLVRIGGEGARRGYRVA